MVSTTSITGALAGRSSARRWISAPAAPRCTGGGGEIVAVEGSAPAAPRTGRPARGCADRSRRRSTAKSPAALSADGGGDLGGGPERAHRTSLTAAAAQLGGDLARHVGIVERIGLVADDLIGLVALAGDHQQVAFSCSSLMRDADRLGAVADLDRARAPGQDLGADRGRDPRCADCRR